MFSNLFLNYLVESGLIPVDSISVVKEAITKTRVKLGLIAVSEKMIDEKQADEINRKQAVMDKRFGDIAVELGYLTETQISRLLDLQGNPYMMLCQVLSDKGYMTLDAIEKAFKDFCVSVGFNESDYNEVKNDNYDVIIPAYLKGVSEEVCDIVSVCIRTVNRLISNDLYIGKCEKLSAYEYDYIAGQSLEGDVMIKAAFSGTKEGMLELASIFASEQFEEVDLDSLDSVGEFINIVNGLHATALSYRKVKAELMAPFYDENKGTMSGDIYKVPVYINRKAVEFIVNTN